RGDRRVAGRTAALRLLQSRTAEDHRRPVGRGDILATGRAPVRPAVLRRTRDTRSRRPGPTAHGPERTRQALPGQRELADQYRLTVPCGPVLLTGHSHGSIIAPAAAAQLPPDVPKRPDSALLTLACPARRLYGRAFPAYFGRQHLAELRSLLGHGGRERWRNAVRRSDYIGSWIFSPPPPGPRTEYLETPPAPACWGPTGRRPGSQTTT